MIFTHLEDANDWLIVGTVLDVFIILPPVQRMGAHLTFRVDNQDLELGLEYEEYTGKADSGRDWRCTKWDISVEDLKEFYTLKLDLKFHVDILAGPGICLARKSIPGRDIKIYTKVINGTNDDGCPHCGHFGEWIRTALVCPHHGFFAGF